MENVRFPFHPSWTMSDTPLDLEKGPKIDAKSELKIVEFSVPILGPFGGLLEGQFWLKTSNSPNPK